MASPAINAPASSLERLFSEHAEHLVWYVQRRCSSRALAEDIVSMSYLAAAEYLEKSDEPTITIGWLYTVARRRLVDHRRHAAVVDSARRQTVRSPSMVVYEGSAVAPEKSALDADEIRRAIGCLKTEYQQVLWYRYVDDLSVQAVADQLQISVKAVEGRLGRARSALRLQHES